MHFPGCRGLHGLKSLPICHGGFVRGYTKNGFNDKLLDLVSDLVDSCERRPKVMLLRQASMSSCSSIPSSAYSRRVSYERTWTPGQVLV